MADPTPQGQSTQGNPISPKNVIGSMIKEATQLSGFGDNPLTMISRRF